MEGGIGIAVFLSVIYVHASDRQVLIDNGSIIDITHVNVVKLSVFTLSHGDLTGDWHRRHRMLLGREWTA
jgi:hypothetical protein